VPYLVKSLLEVYEVVVKRPVMFSIFFTYESQIDDLFGSTSARSEIGLFFGDASV